MRVCVAVVVVVVRVVVGWERDEGFGWRIGGGILWRGRDYRLEVNKWGGELGLRGVGKKFDREDSG